MVLLLDTPVENKTREVDSIDIVDDKGRKDEYVKVSDVWFSMTVDVFRAEVVACDCFVENRSCVVVSIMNVDEYGNAVLSEVTTEESETTVVSSFKMVEACGNDVVCSDKVVNNSV